MRSLKKLLNLQRKNSSRKLPIGIFCYHKSGTVLLTKVFSEICYKNGWKFKILFGKQTQLPQDADVVLFGHSLIEIADINTPFIGLHVIRDPRDVIVSGYHYHRRTTEAWCTNSNLSLKPPIQFPQVPYSQVHRTEAWKLAYLESLNGKSYQDHLLGISQDDGLLFEMRHYGAWTIESMREWDYGNSNVLEVKFEDILNNYNGTFSRIFEHFRFSVAEQKNARETAANHDLNRKSTAEIENMAHVTLLGPL